MINNYGVSAITIGAKESMIPALFFDYIMPTVQDSIIPESVLFPGYSDEYKYSFLNLPSIPRIAYIQLQAYMRAKNGEDLSEEQYWKLIGIQIAENIIHNAARKNIRVCKYYDNLILYSRIRGNSKKSVYELSIEKFPFPDPNHLSWELVLEIRKNKHFHRRLRELRLYVDRNFSGKDANYIEDRLLADLNNYIEDSKKYGLSLCYGAFKKIFSAKSAIIAAIPTTISILNDLPITKAGIIGVSTAMVSISTSIIDEVIDAKSKISNSELAIFMEINKNENYKTKRVVDYISDK